MVTNSKKHKIAVVNFYNSGHHLLYLKYVAEGFRRLGVNYHVFGSENISNQFSDEEFSSIEGIDALGNKFGFRRQWIILEICRRILTQSQNRNVTHIHFLYGDWLIAGIALFWFFVNPEMVPIVTFHWASGAGFDNYHHWKMKRIIQRIAFAYLGNKKNAKYLVHHDIVAQQLNGRLVGKVCSVIPYPIKKIPEISQEERKKAILELNLPRGKKTLLCYGSTRYDKGVDLAVKALTFLPNDYHLIIAGTPSHFTFGYLKDLAAQNHVQNQIHFISHYLTDKEEAAVFWQSSVILIPYRRQFSGVSGPLMQGAAIGKPVVVADIPILSEIVNCYKLGFTFQSENCEDMGNVIESSIGWRPNEENTKHFVNDHSVDRFADLVNQAY